MISPSNRGPKRPLCGRQLFAAHPICIIALHPLLVVNTHESYIHWINPLPPHVGFRTSSDALTASSFFCLRPSHSRQPPLSPLGYNSKIQSPLRLGLLAIFYAVSSHTVPRERVSEPRGGRTVPSLPDPESPRLESTLLTI